MTAAACFIHSQLGLPPDCLSWDLGLWKLESIGPLVWGWGSHTSGFPVSRSLLLVPTVFRLCILGL